MEVQTNAGLEFNGPAIYRITVKGRVPSSYQEQFGPWGLQVEENTPGDVRSILEGEILDQTQLSGILSSLHDIHLSVIEVSLIKTIEKRS